MASQRLLRSSNQDQGSSEDQSQEGSNSNSMEIIIRRVGMEDHINIVKLFQVKINFLKKS
jgi:hypothetical protein